MSISRQCVYQENPTRPKHVGLEIPASSSHISVRLARSSTPHLNSLALRPRSNPSYSIEQSYSLSSLIGFVSNPRIVPLHIGFPFKNATVYQYLGSSSYPYSSSCSSRGFLARWASIPVTLGNDRSFTVAPLCCRCRFSLRLGDKLPSWAYCCRVRERFFRYGSCNPRIYIS
jgi:hypothetical protein